MQTSLNSLDKKLQGKIKIPRFCLFILEKTLQATQKKSEFSFNFFVNVRYKTNTTNQDEVGLPLDLLFILFYDGLLEHHLKNLEQVHDFKKPLEDQG